MPLASSMCMVYPLTSLFRVLYLQIYGYSGVFNAQYNFTLQFSHDAFGSESAKVKAALQGILLDLEGNV